MLEIELTNFGTRPGIVHAQGHYPYKPNWMPIRDAYFQTPPSSQATPPQLTILTCNNGHAAMGLFEKSLAHMGLNCLVLGQGIDPWINSRDKPPLIAAAARSITTEYMLYADSRDAIIIQPPAIMLHRFTRHFSCDLLFGADRLSYPPDAEAARHEDRLAGSESSEFKYLNAGTWIGKTRFVAEFFEAVCRCEPLPGAPESEQGIVRKLLPKYEGRIGIDYRCRVFFNLGLLLSRVDYIRYPSLQTP